MKKIVFFLFAFAVATSLMAQNNNFAQGDKVLNVGIGIGSTLYAGTGYTSKVPPVSVSLEFGFKDDFLDVQDLSLGLGGYFGYTSSKWESSWGGGVWGWEYSSIIIGPRGTLHYPFVDNLDTYTGLMIGYNIVSSKSYGTSFLGDYSVSASGIAWSYYLGARYYFTDNIAAMVELGYGIAYLNLGVALKF
jgi:hypothetical protein